jgi:mono/diheme cytochrome c family protein
MIGSSSCSLFLVRVAFVMAAYGVAMAHPAWADDAFVKRGEYLTTAGDCVACHSAPGGEKFAGGLYMDTPVGKISTPNLTPDKETGIGNWTDDQFYRAMHEGIDDKGSYLYPVFPFPWYTKVTKEDALAIKAYLFSLKPVHAPRKEIKIGFPFNIRTGLLTWRTLFFKAGTFTPDPKAGETVNRGAYLVEGLGHCGECHNRSNLLGASEWSGKLEGGQIEGYYAPNITSDGKQGVGLWKKEDIVTYLKTGSKPDHSSVAQGPMKETITDSLSHMSDADLGAIADYLRSTAAKQSVTPTQSSSNEAKPVAAADAYLTYCASCHQRDGKGIAGAIPPLAGNGAVTAKGPENVIEAVLGGIAASNGLAPMPALGQTMSDADVAAAVNYVRSNWGNNAPAAVGAGDVGKLRAQALTMLAMNRPGACVPVKDAALPDQKLPAAIDGGDVKGKLETMRTSDMLTTIDDILPTIKKGAPEATADQIANALTAAYCPIAMEKEQGGRKSIVLGSFATLVYGQAAKNGKPN